MKWLERASFMIGPTLIQVFWLEVRTPSRILVSILVPAHFFIKLKHPYQGRKPWSTKDTSKEVPAWSEGSSHSVRTCHKHVRHASRIEGDRRLIGIALQMQSMSIAVNTPDLQVEMWIAVNNPLLSIHLSITKLARILRAGGLMEAWRFKKERVSLIRH